MPGAFTPALLNSTSSRPNVSLILAKKASTAAGSLTSVGTASAREPASPASPIVLCKASARRPAIATE